jgi:hypothetical protein
VGTAGFATQFADQPPKVEPDPGTAVKITWVPDAKFPMHPEPEPQLITWVPVEGLGAVTIPVAALLPTLYTVNVGRAVPPPVAETENVELAPIIEPSGLVAMAEIVVEPRLRPVARPDALIVATLTSLELHWTDLVRSVIVCCPSRAPIAINCPVSFTDKTD